MYYTVSTSRIAKINIFGPKLVTKDELTNNQNHLWSVNNMSVILHFAILQRHPKLKLPEIIRGRLYVSNLFPD